eukprot:scaffold580288_cov50-Prasinocladus_malaysianus.AAC.1
MSKCDAMSGFLCTSVRIEKILELLGKYVGDCPYRLTQHAQVVSAPNSGARVMFRHSAMPVAPAQPAVGPPLLTAALATTQRRANVVIMDQASP